VAQFLQRDKLNPTPTSDVLSKFVRVAQTSHYKVEFRGFGSPNLSRLASYLRGKGVDQEFIANDLGEYCNRAAVPGTRLFTKDAMDQYAGMTQKFVYKRQFEDFQMTFMVDYEYKVQKFFELWQEFIVSGSESADGVSPTSTNYYYRMRYPDQYKCDRIRLLKFDRDYDNNIEYNFMNAFPVNIATTPVDYGPSRMLEVTVTFAYDRYVFGRMDSLSISLRNAVEEARTQLIKAEIQKQQTGRNGGITEPKPNGGVLDGINKGGPQPERLSNPTANRQGTN
jgi:hypothetical protein